MAIAQQAVKACRKGGYRALPSPLFTLSSRIYRSHGVMFSTSSSCTETVTPSSHLDFCRPALRLGLRQAAHLLPTCHFWSLGLRSPSDIRFFSGHRRSEEGAGINEQAEDDDELCAEEDDDGEESELGDGDGDGDDTLHLVSETPSPLPVFKDSTEEAAYIGYKVVGRIKSGDSDNFKAPKAFAVVQVGSHQFKISPGDCIYTEKLKFADVNDKLSLEKVLLLGSKSQTVIGRPFVPKAFVHAAVEEQVLDAKVIIFKKKRRKNYRRTTGHRQELTRLRILEIWGLGEARSAVV